MVRLTKLSDEKIVLNSSQIECIETIPESKIIMMNHDFYIVKESVDEILKKIIVYNAKVYDFRKKIMVISAGNNDEDEEE